MLPSELLFANRRGPYVYPRFLAETQQLRAAAVLDLIQAHQGKSRGELMKALRVLEGDSPDYRIVRGFAHLALAAAKFEPALPELDAEGLRYEAFSRAAQYGHTEAQAQAIIAKLAAEHGLDPATLRAAFYGDLPERHLLTAIPDFTPTSLLDRYNLAQAQGLLYNALYLEVNAHRNVPGEYRRLFHRLKFHGLMYTVEGHLEDGYRIHIDGPASLFRQTRKYGLQMAAFLPSLLHISRWEMTATLQQNGREAVYRLQSGSPLVSHYAKPPAFDSLLEQAFAERWQKLGSDWVLEREVEIIDLKGTVFVPDFALRHPDGRCLHIEIVGFWHPDYLRRKFDKVRRAARSDLLLAVSDRLNVGADDLIDIPGPVIFFKGKLEPKAVLAVLDQNTSGLP